MDSATAPGNRLSASPNSVTRTPLSTGIYGLGCGLMTFDTVPGWGLGPNGKSVLGPTHGGVVINKAGNIYTSANIGVFVFSPDANADWRASLRRQ